MPYQNKYLELLSKEFPSVQTVSSELINLSAILNLPKGTEIFITDIHGEYDAFNHYLKNASGIIKEKIDLIFPELSEDLKNRLAFFIYYPTDMLNKYRKKFSEKKTKSILREELVHMIELAKHIITKYTKSKVSKTLPEEFNYIIQELIYESSSHEDKEKYYKAIIDTIFETKRQSKFILELSRVIRKLAVDTIHIVGDIYEMNKAFGINHHQYAWFGGYPGMASLIGDEKRWKDYMINSIIETTISKDILMMNRIDKPALLRRLFELGCFYSGQILSLSKIVGQLQDAGNTTTLSNYIRLLDGAGMLSGLEKTYIEKVRTRASSPKFQVQNNGLMNALRDETFETVQNQPEVWGRIVESAIGAHLLNFSKQEGFALEYWRHKNNEIDFVIRKNNRIIGIEVKSNTNYKTSGMKEFERIFKPDKILLVGLSGLPWQEFLEINPVELF